MRTEDGSGNKINLNADIVNTMMAGSEEEALGQIVSDILRSGKTLSRKTLCMALLMKIDENADPMKTVHYNNVIKNILFC